GRHCGAPFGWRLPAARIKGRNAPAALVIGVPGEDAYGGAVAVLYPDDGVIRILNPEGNQLWQQGRDGIAGGVEAADQFGYAVAAGDFNKDGSADIVVGVKNENSHAGAVNVIYGTPVPTPF